MSLSTNLETQTISKINKYGASVSVLSQLGTANTYDEISSWSHLATTTTKALILPFRGFTLRNLEARRGEEWIYDPQGAIQKNKYAGWFKATETLEESHAISGGITVSTTRYIVYYNSQKYEIMQIKPWEIQDNVFMKVVYLRLITD